VRNLRTDGSDRRVLFAVLSGVCGLRSGALVFAPPKRADGMHALRHADPGFALRTYTHLVSSSHERARVAIDGVFGRPAPDDGLEAA
jgi:hypothetical protein